MKENYIHKSKYFYGKEISEYGLKNGYVDYYTLSRAFDAVLCNDITKLFHSTINGEYIAPELVNGYIDNSGEIEELEKEIEELEIELEGTTDENRERIIQNNILLYKNKIDDLEWDQHESENAEIYQYYIINDPGARILQELTNEIVYYIPLLDVYVWGVCHWGTSWSYVLTNIKIDLEGGAE